MTFEDPELVKEFVVESNEHLADIESQLLDIEAGGASIDVDLVNTVFRAVHSIKGAAGFMGFRSIQNLAHTLENVLNLMRERALVPTSEIMDLMLRAADLLRSMINDIDNSNDIDVSQLVCSLERIAAGKSPGSDSPLPEAKQTNTAEETEEAEAKALGKSDEAADGSRQPEAPAAPPAAPAVAQETTAPAHSTPGETSIRVSVDVLDNLMNLAGELVLGRNQLVQTVNSDERVGLEGVATSLDQITSELQEAIMKTRMQPIGNVFNKFTRVVRDLSNKLGKQCNLQVEGKDVEVDKTIIEAIGDPLTHLVRNSVDHGIEMPKDRQTNHKPPAGTLHLRAYHQSGKVRIEIADDGKGIDPAILKAKAAEKGMLTEERANAMSDREAVRLIFHPGFSMAKEVTDVSGRGVGMDVVRSNIEKLGGTVDIETQVGVGTTIVVTLPLTLAIIPSLIVESVRERFAIPQVNIAELVRIRHEEFGERIGQVKNKEVLRLRGSLLPLVRLRDALAAAGVSADETDGEKTESNVRNIIVVESGPLRYGLVVDDLFDSEEIVVKPLGRHLKDCPCLSGATILGDGRVALILDVAGVAQRTCLRISEEEQTDDANSAQNANGNEATQSVLLFTNDPSEQFAVLMETVARIERIRAEQIDSVGGQELLQYRGGSLPLLTLENLLQAKPRSAQDRLYVVVFEAAGREVGIIAPQLVDIRDVAANFDVATFDDQGVIGSQVIDSQTTRLLDTVELTRLARPDWFAARQECPTVAPSANSGPATLPPNQTPPSVSGGPSDAATHTKVTILLAEDSSFFRRQVKGFLQKDGFEVVDCEDGREAWRTLETSPDRFDLVLTDIEMPNMDGLEFTRKVRSEDRFAGMPIVALTSLASQEDYQRGYDAGVNEYQVKLDREELLAAVRRLANAAADQNQREGVGSLA